MRLYHTEPKIIKELDITIDFTGIFRQGRYTVL